MKTYRIHWYDLGYGRHFKDIEAKSYEDALKIAKKHWTVDLPSPDYGVIEPDSVTENIDEQHS